MSEPQKTTAPKAGEQTPLVNRDGLSQAPPTANGVPPLKTSVGASRLATDTPTSAYKLPKVDTQIQWPVPLGGHPRLPNDESLVIFRRAIGINSDLAPKANSNSGTIEEGVRKPMGIYRSVLDEQRKRAWQHFAISWALNIVHFAQVVIGATLTALGPNASRFSVAITVLGAINTVIAGVLALMKGQGLPERLHKDEMEFRKLQDWIEETEALLATGIIGRDRREVGVLVESAFRKYNSAKLSEENNRPESYVPDPGSGNMKNRRSSSPDSNDGNSKSAAGI
ncbi:hypothetical protein VP1G_08818 [Cytospora mali]|uniref:SMODS and SLOG-associating 2TM effector domain-containing protein n=1 Tax=Cytospora mali TaxID=578113 RepID=A0A194VCD8_CYTMA|nr:hypothetical protein VP1G_08818 [Valsa mali var. pyri (nom. inval.)]